jgi:O-antigen/teichoic acid export membrane protein
LASLASRGGVWNISFGFVIQALAAVQTVVIGRLLGPEILGLYALATGGVVIGTTLKDFGISQKLVQERDTDLYTVYGAAFTLEVLLAGVSFLLVAGAVGPILALAYHKAVLIPVVAALSLSVFTTAFLYLPAAIPYREMNFVRRNLILAVGPVTTFVVTVPAAVFGLGIWSLVVGDLAGFAGAAVVMLVLSPVKPHVVMDRALMRGFVGFGGPLWGAGLISTASGWISTVVVSGLLGVQSVGFFSMSQSWTSQAVQVDGFLADTLFPALCSIQSSTERQRRAFNFTCRLSMGWAAPAGAGLMVFASPLVRVLLGDHWIPAIYLLQAGGAGVMIGSIAYSWNMFYAARGDNRPQLYSSALAAVWLLAIFLPLTIVYRLHGVAASVVLLTIGTVAMRQYWLRKIFGQIRLVTMVWREWVAAGAGAGVVLLSRLAGWQPTDAANLVAQGAVFSVVAFGLFGLLERRLLTDVYHGIRGDRSARGAAVAAPAGSPARPTGGPLALPAGKPMSFPLSVSADPDGRTVWVTTRDWPALGRLDLETMTCEWTEMPPYPHVPSPDGQGGCWTALTRASALAHLDRHGKITTVALPKTRELLVTTVTDDAVWAVDAGQVKLWRVDRADLSVTAVDLPGMRRPDFVCPDRRGGLWVADTHSSALCIVDQATLARRSLDGPHPTRALIADWSGRGMWLGSSTSPRLTLVGWDGDVRSSVELPGIPFGVVRLARGVILATFKDRDSLGIVRTARQEVIEVPLGDAAQPMGCAYVGGLAVLALAGNSEAAVFPVTEELRVARPKKPALVS